MSFTLSSIKKIYSSTPLNNVNIIKIHNEVMNSYSKDTFNSIIKSINLNKLNNKINIIENYTNITKVELSIIYGTQTKISRFPGYVTLLEGNYDIYSVVERRAIMHAWAGTRLKPRPSV